MVTRNRENHDWVAIVEYDDGTRISKLRDNLREHVGFGVGTIGSVGLGLVAKDIRDSRRQKQLDLDPVYAKFRAQFKETK